jgi:hypothetical protein
VKILRFIVHIMTWELFLALIGIVVWSYCTVRIMRYLNKVDPVDKAMKERIAINKMNARPYQESIKVKVSETPQFEQVTAEQVLAGQKEIDEQLEIAIAEWREQEMLEIVLMTDVELAQSTDFLCVEERQRRAELVLKEEAEKKQKQEQKNKLAGGVGEGQPPKVQAQPNTEIAPPLSPQAFKARHQDNVNKAMDAFK